MSDNVRFETIQIESVEQKLIGTGVKNKLKGTNGVWYSMWQTKIDGCYTKAYEAYMELKVGAGSVVDIGFTEEEKSFITEQGTNKNYIERKIISMRAGNMSKELANKPTAHINPPNLEQRVAILETKVAMLAGKHEAVASVPTPSGYNPEQPPLPPEPQQEISVDQIPF